MGTYFGPPTPAYNNPTPVPQFFAPSVYDISAITLGATTTITTAVNHNYVVGQLVRLHIPPTYGSYQLTDQQGYVLSIPTTSSVVVGINSLGSNAFVASPTYGPTKPQICAIGDINSGAINANGRVNNGTTIQGAFINTSPTRGTWLN